MVTKGPVRALGQLGVSTVELAVALPLYFVLLLASIDLTWMSLQRASARSAVQFAARTAARTSGDCLQAAVPAFENAVRASSLGRGLVGEETEIWRYQIEHQSDAREVRLATLKATVDLRCLACSMLFSRSAPLSYQATAFVPIEGPASCT